MYLKKSSAIFWWSGFFILTSVDSVVKIFVSDFFRNYGFVFSIPFPAWLIYVIYAAVLVPLIYYFKNQSESSFGINFAWLLIFSGSASNILERIRLGYVRDFIFLPGGSVINIADIFITLGLLIILIHRKQK